MIHKLVNKSHKNLFFKNGVRIKPKSFILLEEDQITSDIRHVAKMGVISIIPAQKDVNVINHQNIAAIQKERELREAEIEKLRRKNAAKPATKSPQTTYRKQSKTSTTTTKK